MCKEIEDAQQLLLQEIQHTTKIQQCSLQDALGRIAAKDIYAPVSQPPFDRSPLDGYALRAYDSKGASREYPVTLMVIDEVMAGAVSEEEVRQGTAIRIMTGAPIPKGATCVIRQEDTNYGETQVQIYKELEDHNNICDTGEDFHKGQCLIRGGTKLDAVSIGVLASSGISQICVYNQIKMALITTGDEVMEPGLFLENGKIYNSNKYLLNARLEELGMKQVYLETVKDCVKDMVISIEKCIEDVDLIVTTGAVSVGKKDIMHEVLEVIEAKPLFWKVEAKPGTPILASVYKDKLLINLSGNPFAAIVNLELMVRPVLAKLSRDQQYMPLKKQGVMACDFRKASPMRRFVRAFYEDGQITLPKGRHVAGVLGSMKGCNCLIDIPAGNEGLEMGDRVCVLIL